MKKTINEELKKLVENYIKDLNDSLNTDYIEKVYGPITFKIGDDYNKELEDFSKNDPYIYIFSIKGKEPLNLEEVEEAKTKLEGEEYKMFQINKDHFGKKKKCLYVGSSIDLKKRLKEHLGFNDAKKTYALHLNKWYKPIEEVDVKIYRVADEERRQLLEDLLWEEYKPLLGKQGKK